MKIREKHNNRIKAIAIILCFFAMLSITACSKDDQKEAPVRYKKDSLREITFKYPKTYKEDYRNDSQVSYLLNGNEGIIFIIRWDEDVETDMDTRGKPKTVNDIDGYYWKEDGDYTFGFSVKTAEDKSAVYFVSASDKEVFNRIIKSIKIKE